MTDITVPVPAGVVIPEDAVQVPNSYLIWRDGCTVHSILPTGGHIHETYPSEREAVVIFLHFAYMH